MKFGYKKPLVLALVFSLCLADSAFAADVNPFDDVPDNHWAYGSIVKLAQAGIIDGYSDGKFRGGNVLTRYEMAAVIGKAMSNAAKQNGQLKAETKVELQKLEREFSTELKNLGIHVSEPEQNASSIKFGGTARIRYQQNPALTATNKNSTTPSRVQQRLSINMTAKTAKNVTFFGDMMEETKYENRAVEGVNKADIATNNNPQSWKIDRAEFFWKNANYTLSLGRFYTVLGQGKTIWSGGIGSGLDGIYGTYNFSPKLALSAGYADMDAAFSTGTTINARLANLKYQFTDKVGITVANLKVLNHPTVTYASQLPVGNITTKYYFDQTAIGGKAVLGDWTFNVEGVRNNAEGLPANAQRNGIEGNIKWKSTDIKKPGTYSVALEYLKLGNWATDSDWWKVNLWIPGGNYIGGDGVKGFGIDCHYIIGTNIDFNIKYYRVKPYDAAASGFSSYKPFLGIITNWKF